MHEVLQCHTTSFESQGGLNSYQADSRCSKDRTLAHLSRLKERAGIATHKECPRPYRDAPSLKKDLEVALEATRKIQAAHAGILLRKQLTHMKCPTSDTERVSFLADVAQSHRANENIEEFKRTKTYPLNNQVFNTLWQKIFLPKNYQERTMSTEESLPMESRQYRRGSRVPVDRHNITVDSNSYIREEHDFQDQVIKPGQYRNRSFDHVNNYGVKRSVEKESEPTPNMPKVKKDLVNLVRKSAINSLKLDQGAHEKSGMSLADVFRNPRQVKDFKITKRRGTSCATRERSFDNWIQIEESTKYDSEMTKHYLLKMKYGAVQRAEL